MDEFDVLSFSALHNKVVIRGDMELPSQKVEIIVSEDADDVRLGIAGLSPTPHFCALETSKIVIKLVCGAVVAEAGHFQRSG